jgi:hypothetical protein
MNKLTVHPKRILVLPVASERPVSRDTARDWRSVAAVARWPAGLLTAALVGAVLFWSQDAIAASHGPFAKFLGSWRGSGQVVSSNGGSDRINCRATYSTPQSDDTLNQVLVCASDSYRIEVRSNLEAVGREVRGAWTEVSRQVTGNIDGRIAGGAFEGNISGPGFSAGLSLRSTGRRQMISIRPQGVDIVQVQVDLVKGAEE